MSRLYISRSPLLLLVLLACGEKSATDDSAGVADDSATEQPDDTGHSDDSATDDSATDDSSADDSAADDSATPTDEDCRNGADDDLDGLTDCEDADCIEDNACQEVCGNGDDDDLDGLTDCLDEDCWTHVNCVERAEAVFTSAARRYQESRWRRASHEVWQGTAPASASSPWVQNVGRSWTESWHVEQGAAGFQSSTVLEGHLVLSTPTGRHTCSFEQATRQRRSSGSSYAAYGLQPAGSTLSWDSRYASTVASSSGAWATPGAGEQACSSLLLANFAAELQDWRAPLTRTNSWSSPDFGASDWSSTQTRGAHQLHGVLSTSFSSTQAGHSSAATATHTMSWRP